MFQILQSNLKVRVELTFSNPRLLSFLAHSCMCMRIHACACASNEWVSWGWTVDRSGCRPKFMDRSESILQVWLHGRTFDFRLHWPSSKLVMTFFYFNFFFFFFFTLNCLYCLFLTFQYNLIIKHLEKVYDLIVWLFNIVRSITWMSWL